MCVRFGSDEKKNIWTVKEKLIPNLHLISFDFYLIVSCGEDEFQCQLGVCKWVDEDYSECVGPCIPNSWLNDGNEDCTDGSDESEYIFNNYT